MRLYHLQEHSHLSLRWLGTGDGVTLAGTAGMVCLRAVSTQRGFLLALLHCLAY